MQLEADIEQFNLFEIQEQLIESKVSPMLLQFEEVNVHIAGVITQEQLTASKLSPAVQFNTVIEHNG